MNVSTISGLCNEWARIHRLAAWTAFWLIGEASTDDTIDAWHDLYSLPRNEMVHFLGELRQAASDYSDHTADDPLVRIVLAAPGDPPHVPGHSDDQKAISRAGAGLVISSGDPDSRVLVIPSRSDGIPRLTASSIGEDVPAPPAPAIGEADLALSEATRNAASMITSMRAAVADVPDVRLRVGTLTDFYDSAGFPAGFNPRAEKLSARADHLSAIIDTARATDNGATWDEHVLPLLRVIRQARIASLDYAVREMLRAVPR